MIRKVRESDKKQLYSLLYEFHVGFHREKLLKDSPILQFTSYKDPDQRIKSGVEDLFKDGSVVFVAEENGELVGYIHGNIKLKEFYISNKEGYIEDLYVKQDFRNKGIGKLLYGELLTVFKEAECTHVGISAYSENSQAIEFYHKLGFKDFVLEMKKAI
jgi:ribosomal protein S18 acetylase RimI-like enzyme